MLKLELWCVDTPFDPSSREILDFPSKSVVHHKGAQNMSISPTKSVAITYETVPSKWI